jgi:hypothetical protein
MADDVSALDAYREGELPLPPGYKIEHGADVLLLRREGARWWPPSGPGAPRPKR